VKRALWDSQAQSVRCSAMLLKIVIRKGSARGPENAAVSRTLRALTARHAPRVGTDHRARLSALPATRAASTVDVRQTDRVSANQVSLTVVLCSLCAALWLVHPLTSHA
jgi:hypothetical protein